MQDLCIPVESTRGVGGAYRLKPGFRLPPMMFTDEEAFALTLGFRALRYLGLAAFAPATEGAAAKPGRVLPDALRDSANAVEEVVAIEPGPWVISTSAESAFTVTAILKSVIFADAQFVGMDRGLKHAASMFILHIALVKLFTNAVATARASGLGCGQ
jgi:predicted DNA-binding transcriptional regulator YafY